MQVCLLICEGCSDRSGTVPRQLPGRHQPHLAALYNKSPHSQCACVSVPLTLCFKILSLKPLTHIWLDSRQTSLPTICRLGWWIAVSRLRLDIICSPLNTVRGGGAWLTTRWPPGNLFSCQTSWLLARLHLGGAVPPEGRPKPPHLVRAYQRYLANPSMPCTMELHRATPEQAEVLRSVCWDLNALHGEQVPAEESYKGTGWGHSQT